MREIKFRTWDIGLKEMFYSDKNYFCFKDGKLLERDGEDGTFPGSNIIMQYIGLTDKNNKEIYEGDILDMDGLCFVIWKDGAYWVESPGSQAQYLASSRDFKKSTILGNIHEDSINDYWR